MSLYLDIHHDLDMHMHSSTPSCTLTSMPMFPSLAHAHNATNILAPHPRCATRLTYIPCYSTVHVHKLFLLQSSLRFTFSLPHTHTHPYIHGQTNPQTDKSGTRPISFPAMKTTQKKK
ncbi:hypothetical protein ACJQWK_09580 [Exserohilum turcicum]